MTLILGIDEAGRGPCVGSMFIVGVLVDEKDLEKLAGMGVKDSKLLTHKKRIELAKKIEEIAKSVKTIEIKPQEIDNAVSNKDGLNLNWLEAIKQAEIINELNPDEVVIDCPSPNIRAYTNFLRDYIKKDLLKKLKLIVEHRADKNFISCSSASIIAKVMREENVKEIEKYVGESIGSGYPSNPICQKFIKENIDKYPEIFRKSWMTYKNHDNARKQKSLEEF